MKKLLFILSLVLVCSSTSFGQKLKAIKLLQPQTDGGKPLMQVLKARKSSRVFSKKKLSLQMLSNLLWAAYGVNRPVSGKTRKRTAPSAFNWQEVDVYVALAEGRCPSWPSIVQSAAERWFGGRMLAVSAINI